METLWQDFRFGLRLLLSKPGFASIAVVSLALGISANTAIFSLVDAVLLRPLPFHESERLVMVWEDASGIGFSAQYACASELCRLEGAKNVFKDMAALNWHSYNLADEGGCGSR